MAAGVQGVSCPLLALSGHAGAREQCPLMTQSGYFGRRGEFLLS